MEQQQLQQLRDYFVALQNAHAATPFDLTIFASDWQFLHQSETKLIALMQGQKPPDSQPGDIEYGPMLYLIRSYLPGWLITALEWLGMPPTQITDAMYYSWKAVVEQGGGVVASDGTLVSSVPYATFDTNWAWALIYYIQLKTGFYINIILPPVTYHPFGNTPAIQNITGQDTLTIAIMGDWGTRTWPDGSAAQCPSQLVAAAIKSLAPDLVIHLGDVYYSGTPAEEQNNLLPPWPAGALGSYTLNSNHEMYDGGNGYFSTALAATMFKGQANTSYFAISFQDWLLFGLDSAYYDTSTLFASGALSDSGQLSFINKVMAQPGNANKKIIILTHHNAFTYDGLGLSKRSDGTSLWGDLYTALNNRYPDCWYYGHLHNGIVYNDNSTAGQYTTAFGKHPLVRCFGQGAIPFGDGYGFANPVVAVGIDYYSRTSMPHADARQTNRVLNGFIFLTLQQGSITEQAYEVSVDGTTNPWQKTTSF